MTDESGPLAHSESEIAVFGSLTPPYATIVADPPWQYDMAWHGAPTRTDGHRSTDDRRAFPYTTMSLMDIAALPVASIAAVDSHLYLWTTNRYLRDPIPTRRIRRGRIMGVQTLTSVDLVQAANGNRSRRGVQYHHRVLLVLPPRFARSEGESRFDVVGMG